MNSRTVTDTENNKTLESYLREIAHEIEEDKYMLMEYLGPVVDGCRAAFKVDVQRAREITKLTEDDFHEYIDMVGDSFKNITICFLVTETRDALSFVFDETGLKMGDECVDPDVVIQGKLEVLKELLSPDSRISPAEVLGDEVSVHATDPQNAVIALGLLCYPALLRMARSGIDPSSLLADDADSVIMAAASDMVTKMVQKWIDIQIGSHQQKRS
ncbi:MAG: hypothetical protein K9W43_13370 [Candidatus Thorarchaeota archaeon]|nr:hypothetical protein [Candidatus Thorarchaeota archaeon]